MISRKVFIPWKFLLPHLVKEHLRRPEDVRGHLVVQSRGGAERKEGEEEGTCQGEQEAPQHKGEVRDHELVGAHVV